MRYSLFKGLWDKWKKIDHKSNLEEMMQYFKELERYLSGIFMNRISLRENIFCDIREELNVTPNVNITIGGILSSTVEGVLVLQSSEPGDLIWSQSGSDLIYRFESTAPNIEKLKLVIFYRE